MATKIFGHSDDCIIFDSNEKGGLHTQLPYKDRETIISFEDGTILKVKYSSMGTWMFKLLAIGSHFDRIDYCNKQTDKNYSDVVYFKDGLCKIVPSYDFLHIGPTSRLFLVE